MTTSRFDLDRFVAAWRNSTYVERWLEQIAPDLRLGRIREGVDRGFWYWAIPQFDTGRSIAVSVEEDLLGEPNSYQKIREALTQTGFSLKRDQVSVRVERKDHGTLGVTPWEPSIPEKWFPDPGGGHFVAYEAHPVTLHLSRDMPPFLALDGATWEAVGPESPGDPRIYTLELLLPYVPEDVRGQQLS